MLVDVAVERLEELEGERFEEPPILLRLETLMMICFDFWKSSEWFGHSVAGHWWPHWMTKMTSWVWDLGVLRYLYGYRYRYIIFSRQNTSQAQGIRQLTSAGGRCVVFTVPIQTIHHSVLVLPFIFGASSPFGCDTPLAFLLRIIARPCCYRHEACRTKSKVGICHGRG